jgi:hypothetical protein
MRRALLAWIALAGASLTPAGAGDFEGALESRWRGAWVLTNVDTYSDCAGIYTNNHVNGQLVQGRGKFAFRPGEMAQVQKVDLKRSRLDLLLSLPEPILVSYPDGPYTLYREASCLIELQVELPRPLVSQGNVEGVDQKVLAVVSRFAGRQEASRSRGWNRRQREAYPEDYDRTLAEHAAWKAEQANAAIAARIDEAREESSRISSSINSDNDYLKGFAAGVEAAKALDLRECGAILAKDPAHVCPIPAQLPASLAGPAQSRYTRGFTDGSRLVFSLESMRVLPRCMVPVPEAPGRPERPESDDR